MGQRKYNTKLQMVTSTIRRGVGHILRVFHQNIETELSTIQVVILFIEKTH